MCKCGQGQFQSQCSVFAQHTKQIIKHVHHGLCVIHLSTPKFTLVPDIKLININNMIYVKLCISENITCLQLNLRG